MKNAVDFRSNRHVVAWWPAFTLWMVAAMVSRCSSEPQPPVESASTRFENLEVLGALPADQIGKIMNLASQALGVQCSYCHEGNRFASEANPMKEEGRRMFRMTLELQDRHFEGNKLVSCFTCHRGQKIPSSSLHALIGSYAPSETEESWKALPREGRETSQQLLDRIRLAEPPQLAHPVKLEGVRVEPNGQEPPETLWLHPDGRMRLETRYGTTVISEGWNGKRAWKMVGEHPIVLRQDEAHQIQREATIWTGSAENNWTWEVDEGWFSKEGAEANAMTGLMAGRWRETLWVEGESPSGRLVERMTRVPTALGDYEYRVRYDQWRPVAGRPLPHRLWVDQPAIHWMRRIDRWEAFVSEDPNIWEAKPISP
ncbi:MAG: photosynthetic reaction center cytochrome c subunit family protein [Pirellulaceae bacterium]